jgi:hypothetical protein
MYYINPGMVILARDWKVILFYFDCDDERKDLWVYGGPSGMGVVKEFELGMRCNGLDGDPMIRNRFIRAKYPTASARLGLACEFSRHFHVP